MSTESIFTLRIPSNRQVKWISNDGDTVKQDDPILHVIDSVSGAVSTIVAQHYGVLKKYPQLMNIKNDEGDIGCIKVCQHDLVRDNRCLMCMYKFEEGANHTVKVILNDGQTVHVSESQAKEMDNNNIARMLKNQKLTLALDLDHTLLHAVRLEDVVDPIELYPDILHFEIPGIPTPHVLKLRPGLSEFLKDLCSLYDLWIYTHGTRKYAEKIAEIIDPTNSLFNGRIISRSDTPDIAHKALKFLFPSCDDSMIIVLDDRIDVWKENYENVFIIEAFHYFNTRAEINNASGGKANASTGGPLLKNDLHLIKATRVLKAVHSEFYLTGGADTVDDQRAGNGRNVKSILLKLRRDVLRNCNIVFSGVIPLGKPAEADYLWKLALSFGAKPSMTMENFPITHLIIDPRRLGSKKYMEAKEIGHVIVVSPQWLVDSASEWTRLDESKYEITTTKKFYPDGLPKPDLAEDAEPALKGGLEQTNLIESEKPTVGLSCVTTESSAPPSTDESPSGDMDGQPELTTKIKPLLPSSDLKQPTKGILSRPETKRQAQKKSVQFSPNEKTEPPSRRRFSNVPKGRVAIKNGPRPAMVNATGVVATGGSYEFLSNIAKRTTKPSTTKKFNQVVAPQTTPTVSKPNIQNDDDIFRRLAAAEEEEEKVIVPKRRTSELFQERHSKKQHVRLDDEEEDDDTIDNLDDELFS